jgi:hypothetical protein
MKKGQKAIPGIASAEATGTRRALSNQPTSKHNVPGAEVNTIGNRPSGARTVKGMPNKLK